MAYRIHVNILVVAPKLDVWIIRPQLAHQERNGKMIIIETIEEQTNVSIKIQFYLYTFIYEFMTYVYIKTRKHIIIFANIIYEH
jgi:hypothetical protein